VTLWLEETDATERVLTDTLGFRASSEADGTRRFEAGDGGAGAIVDLRDVGGFLRGSEGPGTVHHVAFAVHDAAAQRATRDAIVRSGLGPTDVIDRKYFQSVYFREPAGVLFELATESPGFAVDESPDLLGSALQLPAQYESLRLQLETSLSAIELPG
jgi:glyoxalase family protein